MLAELTLSEGQVAACWMSLRWSSPEDAPKGLLESLSVDAVKALFGLGSANWQSERFEEDEFSICHEKSNFSSAGLGEREFKKHDLNDMFMDNYAFRSEASRRFHVFPRRKKEKRFVRAACHRIVNSWVFVALVVMLIVVNLSLITIESQVLASRVVNKEYAPGFDTSTIRTVDVFFTIIFVLEILVRILGSVNEPWKDSWLVLDVILVFMAVVDVILTPFTNSEAVDSFHVTKIFRVCRAFRAVRAMRLIRFVRPMRVLASTVGEAVQAVFWMVLLLVLWVFCCSTLLCVMWASADPDVDGPHRLFPSVADGMMVLMQVILLGIDWYPELVNIIFWPTSGWTHQSFGGGLVYLAFVVVTMIFLSNAAKGVFVSTFINAARADDVMMDRVSCSRGSKALKSLKFLLLSHSESVMGNTLSWQSFEKSIESNLKVWKELRISKLQAYRVFRLLPSDPHNRVDVDEFLIGLIKVSLRGAPSPDMLAMEFQQQKLQTLLRATGEETFNSGSDSIKGALNGLEAELIRVSEFVQSISEEVCRMPFTINPILNDTAAIEPADFRLMSTLEDRFNFGCRLQKLEAGLREWTDDAANGATLSVNVVYPRSSLLERLPTEILRFEQEKCPSSLTDTIQECLRDDVVPFLEKWFSEAARAVPRRSTDLASLGQAHEGPSPSLPSGTQKPSASSSRHIFTAESLVPCDKRKDAGL